MKANQFKMHPYIEGLKVAFDGSVLYYNDVVLSISTSRTTKESKRYAIVYIKNKSYFISRLVFETWICLLPKNRSVHFLDGNHLNLNYKNLLPLKHDPEKYNGTLKKVRGYEELFINENGTYIIQYGLIINIHLVGRPKRPTCLVFNGKMSVSVYVKDLVYTAFNGSIGRGHVMYRDKDHLNNSANNLYLISKKELAKRQSEELRYIRETNPRMRSKIKEGDIKEVKTRLLSGEPLASIAKSFNTSDMAISRFKHRYLSKSEIQQIHSKNHIRTDKLKPNTIKQIVKELKAGEVQAELASKYGVTPATICRINRRYIRKE